MTGPKDTESSVQLEFATTHVELDEATKAKMLPPVLTRLDDGRARGKFYLGPEFDFILKVQGTEAAKEVLRGMELSGIDITNAADVRAAFRKASREPCKIAQDDTKEKGP